MTSEQLDAIRARFDSGLSLEYDETEALLAEVERLREACTGLVRQNERQYDKMLQLITERDTTFARGVAAMREAAAQKVTSYNIVVVDPVGRAFPVLESPLQTLADEIRALLDPEDK